MTIGIYCILNKLDFKRYIGKSINIEARFWYHKYSLVKTIYNKDCNRHLYNAVQKHGIENFTFLMLETFETVCDGQLKKAELKWMDWFKSCDRQFGYNLRRDSSSQSFVHEETLSIMSTIFSGELNPNYGNRWNDEQKQVMRQKQIARHKSGEFYNENWRSRIGLRTKLMWKNEALKTQMAANVSKAKTTHDFYKFDLMGNLIKIYASIADVIKEHPEYKWQNVYAACNGNKPTYRGFLWKRIQKNSLS